LCDPHTGTKPSPIIQIQPYTTAAIQLAATIEQLVALADLRIGMIGKLSALFIRPSKEQQVPDVASAAEAFTLLLNNALAKRKSSSGRRGFDPASLRASSDEKADTSTAAEPMITSLTKELQTWTHCLETCTALERCK
jgi:hypothetical protein